MAATIPDEFESGIGQLDGYTTVKSGRYARLISAGTFVHETAPTNETDRLLVNLANRHVDIRSFIAVDPDHGRPQNQLDLLHQMENAYHQLIGSIGDAPTGGHWNLTWEDTKGDIQTSPNIPWNVTNSQLLQILSPNVPEDGWIPQIISTMRFSIDNSITRPAVIVTGDSFPFVITLQDETQPPEVRDIGSWVPLFGVDDSGLTSAGTAELQVSNLRDDLAWLQSATIDPHLTQEEVETVAGSVQEAWGTAGTPTGVQLIDAAYLTVGKDATRNNWRSGVLVFNGSAVDIDIVSRTPLTPVNLTALNSDRTLTAVSMIVPEWTARAASLDAALCTLEMTSDANGLFADEGGAGADSNALAFSTHMTGNQFTTALSNFGSAVNWSRVTGVRIHIDSGSNGPPSNGDRLTFLALRGLDDNWVATELDLNTRTGKLESPVSLTGASGDTGLALVSPFIRSILPTATDTHFAAPNAGGDPSLADGTVSLKFNSGKQADHSGTEPTNTIILYLRERIIGDVWDWIHVQLSWGQNSGTKRAFVGWTHATKNADNSNTYAATDTDTATILTDETDYLFSANLDNTTLTITISTIDAQGDGAEVYNSGPIDNPAEFERIRGRVGWYGQFDLDKDVTLDYFRSSNVSFATLRTAIFHSHTPVDGAQLFVDASTDSQLFTDLSLTNTPTNVPTDDELTRDTQKKLGDDASYRFVGGGLNTYSGVQTNIVDFDDWAQMGIEFDVWMPASLSAHNNVQSLTIETSGTPDGGTFKLTHDSAETAAIPYNATAFQVQTALEALGNIGVGNVLVTQGPLGSGSPPVSVIIKFVGSLAGADVSTLVVSNNSVTTTGGTSEPVVTQVGVRPQLYLKAPGTEGDYTVGTIGPFNVPFIPGTWSHVAFDLGFLAEHAVNPYRVQIVTDTPSTQTWWITNIKVKHRSIAWELRAIEDGAWYPFRDSVNDPRSALHLPHSARGKALQLQARALRADAWISAYTLKPHYAELGRVITNPDTHSVDADGVRLHSVITGDEIKAP